MTSEEQLKEMAEYFNKKDNLPDVIRCEMSPDDEFQYEFSGEEYKLWNLMAYLTGFQVIFVTARYYDVNTHDMSDLEITIKEVPDSINNLIHNFVINTK